MIAAIDVLGLRRIVLLPPYTAPTHRREIAFLEHLDVEVVSDATLDLETNEDMARLPPDALERWVLDHRDDRTDSYFISWTALRTAELIARLERPVLTSNQLMVWHALRMSGIECLADPWGQLMRR